MINLLQKFFALFLILILFSCGGGGGSGTSIGNQNNSSSNSGSTSSSSSAQISILYNPASASNEEQTFINSGLNIPRSQFTDSKLIFMSDIQSSEVTKAKTALEAAADIFGHYDIYFYGLGGNLDIYNSEIRSSACNVFGYSDCEGGTMQYLRGIVTSSNGNAGANINGIDSGSPSLLIYQGTNGGSNISQITVIHEYVHIFQHAAMLGMNSGSNRKSPVWFTEGMAQYVAEWLGREKGYSSDSFATLMGNEWDNAYDNRVFHVLKDQIDYVSNSNIKGFDGNKYGQAMWAIAYMIELASARTGVTNGVQVILNDLVSQIRVKGWESAFSDNVGMHVESFYTQFNALIQANDKATRLSNLVTSNVASIYVPTHNYSILQLTGADTEANSGGNPTATKKTIYYFNSDNSETPSYIGSDWPYVRTDSVSMPAGISAEAEVLNGYVLIKAAGSNTSRPVYQYVADNDLTSSGNLISGWSSIDVNGRPISASIGAITNVVPSINNLPSAISVNENQTSVVTISATDNDSGDTLSFSVSGSDSSSFGITNLGVLSFQSAPDYETKNSYNIVINVSDGSNVTSQSLTVNISNVDEAPSFNNLTGVTVAENQTSALTVSASDPDGTSLSYSLSGTDAAALSISSSGVITFNSAPDYEIKNSYTITVSISDGNNLVSQTIVILISDISEAYDVQLGSNLLGEANGDEYGHDVSLSSDGTVLAISAPRNNGRTGHVRVHTWNGSSWTQRGNDIDGEGAEDRFGTSIDLSANGNFIAIGAYVNTAFAGHFRVYSWNGSAWTQRGNDINGEAANDWSGSSIALGGPSGSGTFIAVGAPLNDNGGDNAGNVRIWEWNGTNHVLRDHLTGATAGDQFGGYLDMSSDGQVLAIGALHHDSDRGHVKVYAWNGSDYIQRGSDIDGEAIGDRSGMGVSLSSDGSTVAIGAMRNDGSGTDSGQVRVFNWNGSTWIQRGNDIDGEANGTLLGRDVSLNSDGTTLAVSSTADNNQTGYVKVYDWNGSAWIQNGNDIEGAASGDWCGVSNSLSNNGSILAMGCYQTDNASKPGFVRVHQE